MKTLSLDLLSTEYASNRIVALRPPFPYSSKAPGVRQCIGTNRLWGAMLGKALFDDLNGSVCLKDLVDIAIFSRTILVLEDYADDEFIETHEEHHFIMDWIARIEEELYSVYRRIDEDIDDHRQLRMRAHAEVQRRSQGILLSSVFSSSIEKCLIFFNPYRLKVAQQSEVWPDRIKFLKLFFFACQLLDDYQDLSEDRNKKLNNNIFYQELSPHECNFIEDNRLYWVSSLLLQIYKNLNRPDAKAGAANSSVMETFLNAAYDYIREMIELLEEQDLTFFEQHAFSYFESWNFDATKSLYSSPFPAKYEKFIRPEFMQTYSRGFRVISDV